MNSLQLATIPSFLILFMHLSGCAYRFTNAYIQAPEGIQTIAIEAIYDTGREVIAHEIFWEELQSAFAAQGKLRLAPQDRADAYLRVHLTNASISPTGSLVKNLPERDPKIQGKQKVPPPSQFRPLSQAGEIRNFANISTSLEVEVWNLKTQTVLMRKNYNLSQNFRAVHGFGSDAVTPQNNAYLRYEEAQEAKLRIMAQDLARQVLRDLLVQ